MDLTDLLAESDTLAVVIWDIVDVNHTENIQLSCLKYILGISGF